MKTIFDEISEKLENEVEKYDDMDYTYDVEIDGQKIVVEDEIKPLLYNGETSNLVTEPKDKELSESGGEQVSDNTICMLDTEEVCWYVRLYRWLLTLGF